MEKIFLLALQIVELLQSFCKYKMYPDFTLISARRKVIFCNIIELY